MSERDFFVDILHSHFPPIIGEFLTFSLNHHVLARPIQLKIWCSRLVGGASVWSPHHLYKHVTCACVSAHVPARTCTRTADRFVELFYVNVRVWFGSPVADTDLSKIGLKGKSISGFSEPHALDDFHLGCDWWRGQQSSRHIGSRRRDSSCCPHDLDSFIRGKLLVGYQVIQFCL